jgi:hypothetical protein
MDLTKEQIENWRRVMMMQGFGAFGMFCPEEVVITYARRMKELIETPLNKQAEQVLTQKPKKCPPHENTITGSKGTYCIDCESYL